MADKKKTRTDALGEAAVRSAADRETDPLFVPHLEEMSSLEGAQLASADGDSYSAILETICGVADDSQPVEQYNGTLGVTTAFVAAHQAHAVQVQWNNNLASIYTNPGNVSGVRWGSGTMITADILLTCGHLFDQTGGGWERPRQNGTTNIISPQDIARNMRVNFNFQVDAAGNPRPEQSFAIVELLEYRLGGIDMALCRIAGSPGTTFGHATVSTTDASSPDMICIIGHPAGQRKRIEAGPTTQIDGNLIRYGDIDTLGGNSGSGIWRASDGRIVGVHTNGGCTAQSPGDGGSNFGQRIAAIIAVSPILQGLTAPKRKILDDVATTKVSDDIATLKGADDGGGKRKILDDIATTKVADDIATTKVADDIATLKGSDDGGGKRKVIDDIATLKGTDDVPPKLKVVDDTPPKRKVLDDPVGTLKFRDDAPPKRKVIDDVKLPARDKIPGGENKVAGFDRPDIDPGRFDRPGLSGAARPFILSTPHHAAGAETPQDAAEEIAEALAHLEQQMAVAEASLQQMDAQYRALLAEYEALGQ